jgi:hypothetical protein
MRLSQLGSTLIINCCHLVIPAFTISTSIFILEGPIGRMAPAHLQLVTSRKAFSAVLEIRFRDLQGFKKIHDKDYGLQEKITQRDIDKTRP